MKYTIDTNVYIKAFRELEALRDLIRFNFAETPNLHLTSVVAHELLAGVRPGATGVAAKARLVENVLRPFELRRRVAAPSYRFWRLAGAVRAALSTQGYASISASFLNDIMLAVTCREHGLVLVTENVGDFTAIRSELSGFRFVQPFP